LEFIKELFQDPSWDMLVLDEINIAIEKMRKGEISGRCVIKMS